MDKYARSNSIENQAMKCLVESYQKMQTDAC